MQIHNAVITGSFSYNGADLSNVTSSNQSSASLSTRVTDLESTSSVLVGASSSFSSILSSVSSSQQQISASLLQVSASYTALSGSYNTFSGSASTRVTQIEQVYATTGSNSFRATQSITGSLTVTGQITAQTLNVQQVTSSIVYSSGSNVFGCDLNSRQTFTGSVLITGSLNTVGNTCVTSICSPTIVGGTVSGTTIYGSTAICGAVICGGATTLTGALSGTSATFSSSVTATNLVLNTDGVYLKNRASNVNATQFQTWHNSADTRRGYFGYAEGSANNFYLVNEQSANMYIGTNGSYNLTIASTGIACFACQVCAPSFIGGTVSGTTIYGSTAVCAPSIISSGTICSTGNTCFGGMSIIASCLGIGTASPSHKLEVAGAIGNYWDGSAFTGTPLALAISNTTAGGYDPVLLYRQTDSGGTTKLAGGIGMVGTGPWTAGNNGTQTSDMYFLVRNGSGGISERMRITSGGNVGIGTCSPSFKLEVQKTGASAPGIFINQCSSDEATIRFKSTHSGMSDFRIGASILVSNTFEIYNVQCNRTNYMVNCNGFSKMSPDGAFVNGNNTAYHSMDGTSDLVLYSYNRSATGNGILSNVQPCSTNYYAFRAYSDPYGDMAFIYSNGTFGSRTGTYGGIVSDARCKTEICDASSQWSDIKNLRVRNFKLIEDVENDPINAMRQIGFIAQEVETVSPGLVFESGNGCVDSGCWKNVKTSIIHTKAVKALQEAMCRIEILESCLGIS